MRRTDRIVAAGVLILLGLGFWVSQRPHARRIAPSGSEAPPVRVATARAAHRSIPVVVDAIGTVRSRHQTQLSSRVLGDILEIRCVPGDEVARGDVLVLLDDRDLVARAAQAEAHLRAREQARAEAEVEAQRARGLLPSGAGTQQQVDTATFRLATAAAELEAAAKVLEVARIERGYASIRAPFSGTVFERLAEPGDLAMPGRPILGVYDPRLLRLEAVVEEGHLWRLKVGDALEVRVEAAERIIQGSVSEVVPAVDPASRTGLVKIDLPRDPDLRPGMFGRARIVLAQRSAVVIPRDAVVTRGQLELVFVVVPESARAEMRLVRLGEPIPDGAGAPVDIEVLSGLEAGERVVRAGDASLRDGARVEPAREPGK